MTHADASESHRELLFSRMRRYPDDESTRRAFVAELTGNTNIESAIVKRLSAEIAHHEKHGQWQAVIVLLDAKLSVLPEKRPRTRALIEKARILRDKLFDSPAASRELDRALSEQPNDPDAQEEAQKTELFHQNWQAIAARYLEEAEAANDATLQAALLTAAGVLLVEHSSQPEQALVPLTQAISLDSQSVTANRALEFLLETAKRDTELHAHLTRQLEKSTDPAERISRAMTLGRFYAKRADEANALVSFQSVVALDPTHEAASGYLTSILSARGAYSELSGYYEEALRARPAETGDAEMLAELAALYHTKLEQPGRAKRLYTRVQELCPWHLGMIAFFRERYIQTQEVLRLIELLGTAISSNPADNAQQKLWIDECVALARSVNAPTAAGRDAAIAGWRSLYLTCTSTEPIVAAARRSVANLRRARQTAFDQLSKLFRESAPPKWNALRALIQSELALCGADDLAAKIALLHNLAQLYRNHLRLNARALETYRLIISLAPHDHEALDALAELLEVLGHDEELVQTLKQREACTETTCDRISCLKKITEVYQDKLDRPDDAIEIAQKLLVLTPAEPETIARLRHLLVQREQWPALRDLVRDLSTAQHGEARYQTLIELADISENRLSDLDHTLLVWHEIVREWPSDKTFEALAERTRRAEEWEDLAAILRKWQRYCADDPERSVAIFESLAELLSTKLDRSAETIEIWQRILHYRPDHLKAIAVLKVLLPRHERWDDLNSLLGARGEYRELAEIVQNTAEECDDLTVRRRLYGWLGELCTQHLNEPARAAKAFERVLALDQNDRGAMKEVLALYRQSASWDALTRTYERLIATAPSRHDALTLMLDARDLAEKEIGDLVLAFEWSQRALLHSPTPQVLIQDTSRLARIASREGECASSLLALAARAKTTDADSSEITEFIDPALALINEGVADPLLRVDYYHRALEVDPNRSDLLREVAAIYREIGAWPDLFDTLNQQIKLAGSAAKQALIEEAAQIAEERLADPQRALELYGVLVDQASDGAPDALSAMERLYRVQGDETSLVKLLERKINLITARGTGDSIQPNDLPSYTQSLDEVAGLYRKSMKWADLLRILTLHSAIAQDESRQIAILRERATVARDRLDDAQEALISFELLYLETPTDPQVISALESLYAQRERWPQLADLLREQSDRTPDANTKATYLQRVLTISETQLDDPEVALKTASALLDLSPQTTRAREAALAALERLLDIQAVASTAARLLEPIYRDAENWPQLVALYQREIDRTDATSVIAERSAQIAKIEECRLGRLPEAFSWYLRALTIEPNDTKLRNNVLRLAQTLDAWPALVNALDAMLTERCDKRDPSHPLALQKGIIQETKLGDWQSARCTYEHILSLSPHHPEAFDRLEYLLRRQAQWRGLRDLYQRQLEHVAGSENQRTIRLKSANTLVRETGDPDRDRENRQKALEIYRTLYREMKDSERDETVNFSDQARAHREEIINALEALYLQEYQWSELSALYQEKVHTLVDIHQQAACYCRLGEIYRDRLSDPHRAFIAFQSALAAYPPNEQPEQQTAPQGMPADSNQRSAIEGLESLFGEESERLQLIQVLQPIYRAHCEWAKLAVLYRAQIDLTTAANERLRLWIELSEIQKNNVRDPEAAFKSLGSAVQEACAAPGTRALPSDVLASLEQLAISAACQNDLIDLYEDIVNTCEQKAVRNDFRLRLAAHLEHMSPNSVQRAREHYACYLEDNGDDPKILAHLDHLMDDAGSYAELPDLIERRLNFVRDKEERRILLLRMGDMFREHLDDSAAALRAYQDVLALAPACDRALAGSYALLESDESTRLAALDLLETVESDRGNHQALLALAERRLACVSDPNEASKLLVGISELYSGPLKNETEALHTLMRALVIQPEQDHLWERVQSNATTREAIEYVVGISETILRDAELDSANRTRLILRLGAWSVSLGNTDRAETLYRLVNPEDPESGAAMLALIQMYRDLGRHRDLANELTRYANDCIDRAERAALWTEIATISTEVLGEDERALAAWKQVLDASDDLQEPTMKIAALQLQLKRWEDYLEAIESAALNSGSAAQSVSLRESAGRELVQADKLTLAARLYRDMLHANPTNEQALAALEMIYRRNQDWESLREVLTYRLDCHEHSEQVYSQEAYSEQTNNAAQDEQAYCIPLYLELADISESHLRDLDGALAYYQQVALLDPAHPKALDRIKALSSAASR